MVRRLLQKQLCRTLTLMHQEPQPPTPLALTRLAIIATKHQKVHPSKVQAFHHWRQELLNQYLDRLSQEMLHSKRQALKLRLRMINTRLTLRIQKAFVCWRSKMLVSATSVKWPSKFRALKLMAMFMRRKAQPMQEASLANVPNCFLHLKSVTQPDLLSTNDTLYKHLTLT